MKGVILLTGNTFLTQQHLLLLFCCHLPVFDFDIKEESFNFHDINFALKS
jgi:hypothetical protein